MQLCQSILVKTDAEMIRTLNVGSYFKYISLTACGWGRGDRVIENISK
jgi:hypothetical protein